MEKKKTMIANRKIYIKKPINEDQNKKIIIHDQLRLKCEIKNNKTLIKELRKKKK
jgi:hypothetical protein